MVASFTDAWIETSFCAAMARFWRVASFTDAWIETGIFGSIGAGRRQSHLLQMRGLKLVSLALSELVDASHLLQMRGLKQLTKAQAEYTEKSHLLQMRGLKHA